jgi:hypothetical protein
MALTSHSLPSADDFARLEGELFTRLERSHTRQVRRHRFVAAAAIVLVAAGGTVAAGTVANQKQQNDFAYCYSGSDTSSQSAQITLPDDQGANSDPAAPPDAGRVQTAVTRCGQVWNAGVFGASTVPTLQPCIQDNLLIAVFAKPDSSSASVFCGNLGMSAP